MTDHEVLRQEEPAEHLRFRSYVRELERVTEVDEVYVIGAVLADSDQVMARSAVLRHLDRRAAGLSSGPGSVSCLTHLTGRSSKWPQPSNAAALEVLATRVRTKRIRDAAMVAFSASTPR
ncbi:hypothetical protein [Streptomyces sp. NPDC060205]|uniref:hypothetical protein n=1 Tax=Streptomyces sp. NPDC060205 TaxID=3347072 RepID=UPI003665AB18